MGWSGVEEEVVEEIEMGALVVGAGSLLVEGLEGAGRGVIRGSRLIMVKCALLGTRVLAMEEAEPAQAEVSQLLSSISS
jgi:hypothetical protein